jgi:hypothetical protein
MDLRPSRAGRAIAVIAALASLSATDEAPAQQPRCGQVVTEDVRLEGALVCRDTGAGLIVGADGVTIDLNGYGITQGIGFRGPGVGIDNGEGHDGVTVRNGRVGADGTAIRLIGASGNRLTDVSAGAGAQGMLIQGGSDNTIARSAISSFNAIRVQGSDGIRIVRNSVGSSQDALTVEADSGLIARNTVEHGRIFITGNGNRVVGNSVTGAIHSGIRIAAGSSNVVARNRVVDTLAVIEGDDSTGDGIHVAAFTAGTRLTRNVAIGNGDDGIDLDSAAARLVRNLANDNDDLGIDALPGTRAAGNRARGNGDPAQCAGISCA